MIIKFELLVITLMLLRKVIIYLVEVAGGNKKGPAKNKIKEEYKFELINGEWLGYGDRLRHGYVIHP